MTLFSETVAAAYSQGIAFSDELGQAAVDRKNNTFEDRSTSGRRRGADMRAVGPERTAGMFFSRNIKIQMKSIMI